MKTQCFNDRAKLIFFSNCCLTFYFILQQNYNSIFNVFVFIFLWWTCFEHFVELERFLKLIWTLLSFVELSTALFIFIFIIFSFVPWQCRARRLHLFCQKLSLTGQPPSCSWIKKKYRNFTWIHPKCNSFKSSSENRIEIRGLYKKGVFVWKSFL